MDRITELELRMRVLEAALATHLIKHAETDKENAQAPEENVPPVEETE